VAFLIAATTCPAETLRYHTLVTDGQGLILPWYTPSGNAFGRYLDKGWEWAVAAPNDPHGLPISFLYCSWYPGNPPTLNPTWENDVGEKIPNWVESARLYYQYSGNRAALDYVKRLVDYSLVHGQTPANHVWPAFPVGTSNAGDTEFRGFTGVWALWDCHVDLAAHIGWVMYRMYQMYGDTTYRDKAMHVADLLAGKMTVGTATDSPWPYVVNSRTGVNKSRYAASWSGALRLFDLLIANNQGNVAAYTTARAALKNWLLTYPMQNGNWVDGHSDVKFNGTGNWSATCASDMCLYLFDNPGWDPNFATDVPRLLKWLEDNFVNVTSDDGLPGQYHGAFVPDEQTAWMYRMGYETARMGATYAQWYAVTGNAIYKDRAYRCFSYDTYMMQDNGQSSDGPTEIAGYWWSDCFGEAPRMYYYGLAAVPEWAPPGENHLLHSSSVVNSIVYTGTGIGYTTFDANAAELFRLVNVPAGVTANGNALPQRTDLNAPGWTYDSNLGVLSIRHDAAPNIQVAYVLGPMPPTVSLTVTGSLVAPATLTLNATASDPDGSVAKVAFYSGTSKLSDVAVSPYVCTWSNVPAGTYTLSAIATDNVGLTATASQTVTVTAPAAVVLLGSTNEGTFTDDMWDNGSWINATRFAANASGTVGRLFGKVTTLANGRYQCAVYADKSGAPGAFLGGTVEVVNPPTSGWYAFPLTSTLAITKGAYYWLAIWSDSQDARVYASNGGAIRWGKYAYGTWPSTLATTGGGSFGYSIYATGP